MACVAPVVEILIRSLFWEYNMFDLLYYPKIEPPHTWLRRMLLLADSLSIFVPSVDDLDYTDELLSLREALPTDTIRELTPNDEDLALSPGSREYLERACKLIAAEPQPRHITVTINGGDVGIEGYVFVHQSKFTDETLGILSRYKLAGTRCDNLARNLLPTGSLEEGWHMVEERAADLVIACSAEQLARRLFLDTVTDDPLAFAVTALPAVTDTGQVPVDSALLGALAQFYVPAEISTLSVSSFQEVHESYADLRRKVDKLIRELANNHRLNHPGDERARIAKVKAAIDEFDEECRSYRRSAFAKRFIEWSSIVVGGLLTVSLPFVADPAFAAAGGGGAFMLDKLAGKVVARRPEPSHWETYKLLCGGERSIMKQTRIDRLTTER
jgi:hypothetical protein